MSNLGRQKFGLAPQEEYESREGGFSRHILSKPTHERGKEGAQIEILWKWEGQDLRWGGV